MIGSTPRRYQFVTSTLGRVHLVGRGDERIRATHAKTLELIAGTDLTERGTCVIAVATTFPAGRIAGPVRVAVRAGDESFGFDARANSGWTPDGSAVIRRGPLRLPGTLATHASVGASDLPPGLVTQLRDPQTVVTVTLDPRPGERSVVLYRVDADPARLAAEVAAADEVMTTDAAAARLVGSGPAGRPGGRTLVVTTRTVPTLEPGLLEPGVRVETIGFAPDLAAAAAAPWGGPVLLAADAPVAATLRSAPAHVRAVLATDRRGLPALLRQAREIRGSRDAVVVQDDADPVLVPTDAPGEFPGADRLFVCPGPGPGDLDPAVRAAVDGLIGDGVPTRVAARALAVLTGWPQRQAYDAVLARRSTLER